MDCSPWDSSVHGILQARILEWGCHPSPSDLPDCIAGGFFTIREALKSPRWVQTLGERCRDRDESWFFFFNWQRVKILGLKESRDCQRAISPPSEIFHSLPTWMTDCLQDPGAYPKHPLLLPSVIIHTYLLIKPERKVHHLCTNSTFVLSLKHSFLENIYWHWKES